jgi:hypothetical protein
MHRPHRWLAQVAPVAEVPFSLLDESLRNRVALPEQQLRFDHAVARVDVQVVREAIGSGQLAVGTRLEDRQVSYVNCADPVALSLELGKGGAGGGRGGIRRIRFGGDGPGQGRQAGRKREGARPTQPFKGTRKVGRIARRGSTADEWLTSSRRRTQAGRMACATPARPKERPIAAARGGRARDSSRAGRVPARRHTRNTANRAAS